MVKRQIRARGVTDEAVLAAMGAVPRELFVGSESAGHAYDDAPQPILEGQTISQPYVVAYMIEALHLSAHHRVLEVGTGSGYAAAVLSHVCAQVFTIERHDSLARLATWRLHQLGLANVHVRTGDGTAGWSEHAPYDGILVSACAPFVPQALRQQLAIRGRLVIPVGGSRSHQELRCIERRGVNQWVEQSLGEVRFVPLVGEAGWREPDGAQGTGPYAEQP